jgi:RNase P/RNase MRP subunit p29
MKLAIYSSRTRGFDGQIFVVRTVNTWEMTDEETKAIVAKEVTDFFVNIK